MTSRNRVRRRQVRRRSARDAWMDRSRQQGAISLREIAISLLEIDISLLEIATSPLEIVVRRRSARDAGMPT